MGKKTLYHPVGLYVIRGSFENAGYQLGRLTQLRFDIEAATATYRTEIADMPLVAFKWGAGRFMQEIAKILPDTLRIAGITIKAHGRPVIWLEACANPVKEPNLDTSYLSF